jgi:hypothetical protein
MFISRIDVTAANGQEVLLYFKEQLGLEISSFFFSIAQFYNAGGAGSETSLLAGNTAVDLKNLKG